MTNPNSVVIPSECEESFPEGDSKKNPTETPPNLPLPVAQPTWIRRWCEKGAVLFFDI